MLRLQRFLAEGGTLSRRKAEELIAQARVTVNGQVAGPGTTVDPEKDHVRVDGETVRQSRHHLVLMMHKPKGVVCSEKDPEGRRNVYSLLPDLPVRVHSVGRLDLMSEGLLLFTNDGDLTRQLTRSASGVERVYEAKIQGGVPAWALERLERGVTLDDGRARASSCKRLRVARTNEWLEITMTEGRYREVRRMFQSLGMNVLKLKRVRFGPLRLGKMPAGAVRALTPDEITALTENRPPKPVKPPKAQRAPRGPRSDRAADSLDKVRKHGKTATPDKGKPARAVRAGRTQGVERHGRPEGAGRPDHPLATGPVEQGVRPGQATGFDQPERTRHGRPGRPAGMARPPARTDRTDRTGRTDRTARPGGAGRPGGFGRSTGSQERPDPDRRPTRGSATRFGHDRDARSEGDSWSDGDPTGRRFEAEVAAAVRKVQALKGGKPGAPVRPAGTSRRPAARGVAGSRASGRDATRSTRPGGDRPARPARPDGDRPTRPARPGGDRPARPARPDGDRPTRPARPGGDRPARPARPGGDRPTRPGKPAARTSRAGATAPGKPAGRPAKPAGKPRRSVHANKPQKV